MARTEDYALIGDTRTAALVDRDGSIDWLCLPRFDSDACFAALLGGRENGRWQISPRAPVKHVQRRYRRGSLILETELEVSDGRVRLVDFMVPQRENPTVVRLVEGLEGQVPMQTDLVIRFGHGLLVPWLRRVGDARLAVAGPDALTVHADVELHGEDLATVGKFQVARGDRLCFQMQWHPSTEDARERLDGAALAEATDAFWTRWSSRHAQPPRWAAESRRSLITLKALIYAPTGGIVAAPTTSLPEKLGGVRNWDYRYCWLRDATFSLFALLHAGYVDEAKAWRDWLLRAVAGSPEQMQILYGAGGERRLWEAEVGWLPGYEQSRPVRVGNAASSQFQLDVYGEIMDVLHLSRLKGIHPSQHAWDIQRAIVEFVEGSWQRPDDGIWEMRGPSRHFTHSKVMAWVALDRAVKAVERFELAGPADRWRALRDAIHREVCEKGWNPGRGAFTQYYGSDLLDASLLMLPLVGFLSPTDERIARTVAAIERELMRGGFVMRYAPDERATAVDALPPGEGAFLPCTLWLADCHALAGRRNEAVELLDRVLGIANDVGLLSEEYDPDARRLVGNFPQAFTHVAVLNTIRNLAPERGPAEERGTG